MDLLIKSETRSDVSIVKDGAQKWTGTAYIISILGLATGRGMTPGIGIRSV